MMGRKCAVLIFVVALASAAFAAGKEKILYTFHDQNDGGTPVPGVILDKDGNLYGASAPAGCTVSPGNVFELKHSKSGWSEDILYLFTGNGDGGCPQSGLIFDKAGHLFGTTALGGDGQGWGVVYGLARTGSYWTESLFYQFNGETDGGYPMGGVALDDKGNLFGTTFLRGDPNANLGVIYEVTPQPDGEWIYQVIHTFEGSDGSSPKAAPVVDNDGNVFGAAYEGGGNSKCTNDNGCGVIYELTPSNGNWTYTVLYSFANGKDGGYPWSQLVLDKEGNLYGTTESGGANNFGTVFEMKRTKTGWKEIVLHSFTGHDGMYPWTGVTFGNTGNLYGVTNQGGTSNLGVVYELAHTAKGWKESVLHSFAGGSDGSLPEDTGGVAVDPAGNVYGTTYSGGSSGAGIVFEITP